MVNNFIVAVSHFDPTHEIRPQSRFGAARKLQRNRKYQRDDHAQGRSQMKCQNHMKLTLSLSALRFSWISINSELMASLKTTSRIKLFHSSFTCKTQFAKWWINSFEPHANSNVPKRKLLRLQIYLTHFTIVNSNESIQLFERLTIHCEAEQFSLHFETVHFDVQIHT